MKDAKSVKEILRELARQHLSSEDRNKADFVPGETMVNYSGRVFDSGEIANLLDASLEFWLTNGRFTKSFERGLADFLQMEHCLFVNSGSSANLLAFMALTSPLLKEKRICRGDEVITVAAGFPTTVAPLIQYGAVPVFVDVDISSANIDVSALDSAYSERTKALVLAHTLGNPFDLDAVRGFCDSKGLWLIEDNCDALGSRYRGEYTGTFGDIGTSSFYPPHHITTGEGGAVYTSDPLLAKIMRSMRDWGRDCVCESGTDNTCGHRFSKCFGTLPFGYDHKYVYSHFGYNLKATDLQAAIGCAQLEKLPEFTARRIENHRFLKEALEDLSDIFIFQEALPDSEPSWFGFLITLRDKLPFTRNRLIEFMENRCIQTRNLFAGNLTRHPCFDELVEGRDYRISGTLENTDKIMNHSFWIGVYPGMSREKLDWMVQSIRDFLKNNPGWRPVQN